MTHAVFEMTSMRSTTSSPDRCPCCACCAPPPPSPAAASSSTQAGSESEALSLREAPSGAREGGGGPARGRGGRGKGWRAGRAAAAGGGAGGRGGRRGCGRSLPAGVERCCLLLCCCKYLLSIHREQGLTFHCVLNDRHPPCCLRHRGSGCANPSARANGSSRGLSRTCKAA